MTWAVVLKCLPKYVAWVRVPFQVPLWTAILAASLLTVLGVVAGLMPAARAMQIKPVDAMRDE